MVYVKKYIPDRKIEWDDFVNNSKIPMFMFNRDFMEYHKDRFIDASIMFYDENDELIGVFPASVHDDEIRSHGGLTYGGIISGEKMKQQKMLDCFDAMKMFYRDLGINRIIYKSIPFIYHLYPAQEDLYALFLSDAVVQKVEPSCTIDLTCPYEMQKRRERQISKAIKCGVVVKELHNENDFANFIELQNEVLCKYHNTVAVHTGSELCLLNKRFPCNIRLYGAFKDEKLIAGTVLFEYDDVIHTQYLAANDEARKIGALDVVISTIIEVYKNKKRWLDFGISTEQMGRLLNNGLISQKEGFGGRTVAYQTWEMQL